MSAIWKSSFVSAGLKPTSKENPSKAKFRGHQNKQMQLEYAKLEQEMKLLQQMKEQRKHNEGKKDENVALSSFITPLHPNLMRTSSSTKSVRFADELLDCTSKWETKSKCFARKLFDESHCKVEEYNTSKSDILECSEPEKSLLTSSNGSICSTGHNDSNAEFKQYEGLCENLAPQKPEDIASTMKKFIEKQNAEMLETITKLLKDNHDVITAKFEELQSQLMLASDMNKENSPLKSRLKRKSGNLRRDVMKRSMQGKCPDTPATQRKMKASIDIYNGMRQNLDSPRPFASALNTPDKQPSSKKALSLIVQKQCLALVE